MQLTIRVFAVALVIGGLLMPSVSRGQEAARDDLLIRYAPSRAVWALSLRPKRLHDAGLGVVYEAHEMRRLRGLAGYKADDIEQVVLFGAPGDPRRMVAVGVVASLAVDADTEALTKAFGRNVTQHEVQGKSYLSSPEGCYFFPDPHTLVFTASALDMEPILAGTNRPRELVELLLQADRKADVLACAVGDHGGMSQMFQQTPGVEYLQPLLARDRNKPRLEPIQGGIEAVTVELQLTESPRVTARLDAVDAAFASAVEALASGLRAEFSEVAEQARGALEQEPGVGQTALSQLLDAIDRECTVRRDDRRVVVEAKLDAQSEQVAELLSRMVRQTAGDAAFRPQAIVARSVMRARLKEADYKLKQIGIGMHNYHDTYTHLPSAGLRDGQGKELLSWRVAILLFLGEHQLYDKFALDEPWDSPTNKPLVKQIPAHFFDPALPAGHTRFQVLTGKGALFGLEKPQMRDISDGTANTIMVVQAGPDKATPWTKPGGLDYQAGAPAATLGQIGEGFWAVFADGFVSLVPATVKQADFRRMAQHADDEAFQDFAR